MILPLRRQHRLMIAALIVVLVIIFLAGILVRPESLTPPNSGFLPSAEVQR